MRCRPGTNTERPPHPSAFPLPLFLLILSQGAFEHHYFFNSRTSPSLGYPSSSLLHQFFASIQSTIPDSQLWVYVWILINVSLAINSSFSKPLRATSCLSSTKRKPFESHLDSLSCPMSSRSPHFLQVPTVSLSPSPRSHRHHPSGIIHGLFISLPSLSPTHPQISRTVLAPTGPGTT
ncbi:hypothetical protein BC827DRAFT_89199 [Russula dissimulans]|nr:hypothetical protein BC827DRAFT_89199 [Russula dissimulans]